MANKPSLKVAGTWATIQAAASVGAGAISGGTRTTIAAALTTGDEADYAKLDMMLTHSAGSTPAVNELVHVFRRSKADGTNESPVPSSTFRQEHVGSFVLQALAAPQYYYLYGITNEDKNATYYLMNDAASATMTLALSARGAALDTPA